MDLPVAPATLLAFLSVALAIVVSPGPDTLLILRNTLNSGTRTGMATVAGVQLGLIGHTALAALGLSVVIASSPRLFGLVALAGGGYLGWLGLQSFRGGLMRIDTAGRTVGAGAALRDAMLTNLLNPKVILLFLALMPGFVDPARAATPQLVMLALALLAINIVWQVPVALAAEAARRQLSRPMVQRWINRLTGAILTGFGVLLIWDHGGGLFG